MQDVANPPPPISEVGCAHQTLENLGEVAGMEHDQPHPILQNPALDLINDRLLDLPTGATATPDVKTVRTSLLRKR